MSDSELQDLTESTSPALTDLIYGVIDPDSTPASRKITLTNFFGAIGLSYASDRLYVTNVATARAVDRTSGIITSSTSVSDSDSLETLWTGTADGDAFKVGNLIKIFGAGHLSNASASDDITLSMYLGSTQLGTYKPSIANYTAGNPAGWHIDATICIRTVGSSGTAAVHGHVNIHEDEVGFNDIISSIDFTSAQDITIKCQWDNAKADNIMTIDLAYMGFKN